MDRISCPDPTVEWRARDGTSIALRETVGMPRFLVFTPIALVGFFVACSTYTAESSKGGLGEPCTAAETCDSPLVCVGGRCENSSGSSGDSGANEPLDSSSPIDSGNDAPLDGTTLKDAGSDVVKPAPCDALPSTAPAGVVECVDVSCLPGKVCCSTGHTCLASCGDPQVAMPCDGTEDCPMGNVCCAELGNTINTAVCPRSGSFTKLKTRCSTSCSLSEVELCTDVTCPAGKRCTRVIAQLGPGGGASFNIGYCE
ncbi:MAG: hypothetical protein U0174_21530 [Polyangiaceae bacterium]